MSKEKRGDHKESSRRSPLKVALSLFIGLVVGVVALTFLVWLCGGWLNKAL